MGGRPHPPTGGLGAGARAPGHRVRPDLDALSDVVACEVERQAPYLAGKARPAGGQPWGPGAAGPVGGEVA